MANVPNGATMMVVVICAVHMTICCSPIGKLMRNAFLMHAHVGMKLPLSRLSFSSLERTQRKYIMSAAVMTSANAVPNAAPLTDNPAPGM